MREHGITAADRRKRRWATTISNLTIPPVIAVFAFVLINYTVSKGLSFIALTLLTTLFAAVMPLGILVLWRRRTDARDIDIPLREERGRPLLLAAVSYVVGTAILLLVRAPPLVTTVLFAYGLGTFIIFFINLRWKISIHTMAIAGPTTVLVFVFGAWGVLLGLLLPPVTWSRVYLKKHTLAQALAGIVAGVALTVIAMWLLFTRNPLYSP